MEATPNTTPIQAHSDSLRSLLSHAAKVARRRVASAREAYTRVMIRGQLGPSVGHPSDRRPEPRF